MMKHLVRVFTAFWLLALASGPVMAQSGGTIFAENCSGCHARDLVSDKQATGNAIAPALGPYVQRFDADIFVQNIRNGRLLAPPMRTFEGELSDANLRSVWTYIHGVMEGEQARVPARESPEQRDRRERCEVIKTRMNATPDSPPDYYPPGHDKCDCGVSGADYCPDTDVWGNPTEPFRPRHLRYCKPWVLPSEREYYARYCQTVRMIDVVEMDLPPIPLQQAPSKLKKGAKTSSLPDRLRPQEFKIPEAVTAARGPAPLTAELSCRAGPGMRLEATRPASLDWVPRWDRRRGIESQRGNGEPDMFDEHWRFTVHATLAAAGSSRPAAGECFWSAPNAYGLQINSDKPEPLAIDIRVLSDNFPFDRLTVNHGGAVDFNLRGRRNLSPENPTAAAIAALSTIRSGTGGFTVLVRASENPAPANGVIVEHVGNDTLSFREPPTGRIIGPE